MAFERKLLPKDRDAALARERMRRLRAGKQTTADRAYHLALAALRENHRAEFEQLREEALRKLQEGA